jgi:predicted nucleotidyltransferase
MSETPSPTPDPAINALVAELLARVRAILGTHFIGMYLEGSLANGGFDEDSDIDFVVVTDQEVTGNVFLTLQAMHDQLATLDTPWAIELEGSYLSAAALRRDDPALRLHPNIERGRGERLKMTEHDASWNVHRWVLRERGIVLAGPAPAMLIDPVTREHLQQAMRSALSGWATSLLGDPAPIQFSGYQSYVVLSL